MKFYIGLIFLVLVALLGSQALFTVSETEFAIKTRFGSVVDSDFEPGLHTKLPFVNQVRKFDKRAQALDAQPERFITSEKKHVTVDFYVMWRIDDVVNFYTATRGDVMQARQLMLRPIKDGLRAEFAERELTEVVAEDRNDITDSLRQMADEKLDELGVTVVDVRVKKIELPDEVSSRVYDRMRAERQRVASDLRSRGREQAERIRAEADRKSTIIVAEAERDARIKRGDADAEAARIYAEAYESESELYRFLRSLETYRKGFNGAGDVLVLDPESPLLQYLPSANASADSD